MINSFEAKDFCTTEAIVSFEGNFTAGEPSGLSQSTNSTSRNPLLSASNFLRLDSLALSTCYEPAYEDSSGGKSSGEASPVPHVITDDQMFSAESGSPDKGQHSGCSITTTTACPAGSGLGQFGENGYFRELAELVQMSLSRPELLEGVNSSVLRETIRQLEQLKEKKQEEKFAVQHEDVSSTAPTLVASHIGPMLLEALDGFLFVLNAEGTVEFVSPNVEKYLRCSQTDMVSQNIGNLVSPADHELFSKLLPSLFQLHSTGRDDSQSLMDPTVEYHNERRSHTFLCQFRVSSPSGSNIGRSQDRPNRSEAARVELGSNDILSDICISPRRDDSGFLSPTPSGGNSQRFFDSCRSSPPSDGSCLYESLQVSAISLSYPIEGDREEFLSYTVTEHTGAQPCLVCVARRLPGKCNSTGSVACSPVDSDVSTGDRFGGNQLLSVKPLVFSLKCTSDLTILAVDFKDSGLQQLFSKDLFGMPIQCLCYPPDAHLFVDWLRRAARQCGDKSTTVRFAINRKLLLLQARGTLCRPPNPFNSDFLQLDFRVVRIGDNLGTVAPESPMPTTQSRLSPSAFSRSQSALDAVGVSDGKSNSFRCVDVSPAQSNQSPTSTMIECGNSKGDPNESTYQQQGGISNRIRPASSLGVSGTLGDYNFSGIPNKFQSYFGEGLDDSSSVERFGDSDKRTSGPKLTKKLSSNSAHSDLLNEVSFGLDYLNSQAQAAHTTQQKTQAIYAKTNGDSSAPPNSFTAVSDNSSDRVANETQSGEGFMQEECGNDFFGDFGYLQFPNNKGDFDLNQMERNDHYMNMMTVANRDKLHELCSFVFGDEGLAGTSAGPITEVPYGQQTPAESRATPTASRTVATSQQQQQFSYSDRQDNLNQPGPQDVILKELLTQDDVCTTVEPPPPKKKSTKRTAGRAATVDSDAITSPQFQCLPDSNVLGITQAISSSAPPPKKRRATQKNKILEQLLKEPGEGPVVNRAPMSAPHTMTNFPDHIGQSACPIPSPYQGGSQNDQILQKLLRDNESQLSSGRHSNPSNLPDSSCFNGLMSPGGQMPPNIQNPAFSKWKSSPYGEDTGNTSSNMEEMGHQQHFGQCGSVPKAPISINNHNFGQMPNRRSSPSPSVSSPATVGSSTPGVSKLVEKNCMLVKLLAQTPHTTPTLPTSIATSNYDKMAKENKENPNKPRVATGLVESLLNRNRTAPNPVVPPPIGVNHVSSSTVPSPFMPAAAGSDQMLSQMSFARHRPPAYNELDLYSNSHLQQPPPNQPTQMPTGFPGSIGSQNGNWSVPGGLPMQQMMNSAYGNTNGPNGGDFFPPQPQDFGGNSFNRGDMPFMQNPTYSGTHGEMLNPNLPMSMAQRHVGMPPPTLNDSTGPYANSQGMAPNRNSLVSSMLESRSQPIPQYSGNSKGARRETAVRAALETPPNRQPLPQHQQHQAHMKRGRSVTDLMFENPDQQPDSRVMSVPVPLSRHESFSQFQTNLPPGFNPMNGGDMQGSSQMPVTSGPNQGFNVGPNFSSPMPQGFPNGLGPPNSAPPVYGGMNGRNMPSFQYPPEEMRPTVQHQQNWPNRTNSNTGRGGPQRETIRNGRSQAQRTTQSANSQPELNLPGSAVSSNMPNGPNNNFGNWNGSMGGGMVPNQNLLRAEMRKRAMSAVNDYPGNQQRMLNLGGDGTPQSNQFFGNFPNGFGYQPMPGVHPSQMGMFDQQGQMASYQQGSSNGGQQQDPNGLGFDFNFSNGMEMEEQSTDNILQQLLN